MRNSRQRRMESTAVSQPTIEGSKPFRIARDAQHLKPSELPISVRLENVLRTMGITRLGELHGLTVGEFAKERNCGKRTIVELRHLLERVANGEFQPARKAFSPAETGELLRSMDEIIERLPLPRDRKIFLMRLGAETEDAPILKEVGAKYKVTRERVRQIEHKSLSRIRREGGPRLAAQLTELASMCRERKILFTPALLSKWLGQTDSARPFRLAFYARLLNRLNSDIPVE